jgi:hypothetical protein
MEVRVRPASARACHELLLLGVEVSIVPHRPDRNDACVPDRAQHVSHTSILQYKGGTN